MAALKYELETTYINSWAESGYSLKVYSRASKQLRSLPIDLTDVRHLMGNGVVVDSDMLENHGLWCVRGETVDGEYYELSVVVISMENDVELRAVASVERA